MSKPSAMMVCNSSSLINTIAMMLIVVFSRDGHVHEGQ